MALQSSQTRPLAIKFPRQDQTFKNPPQSETGLPGLWTRLQQITSVQIRRPCWRPFGDPDRTTTHANQCGHKRFARTMSRSLRPIYHFPFLLFSLGLIHVCVYANLKSVSWSHHCPRLLFSALLRPFKATVQDSAVGDQQWWGYSGIFIAELIWLDLPSDRGLLGIGWRYEVAQWKWYVVSQVHPWTAVHISLTVWTVTCCPLY